MNLHNKFFKIALLLFILIAAIGSTVLTYYAMEHSRLKFCYWVRKILPTHTVIRACEELFYEYPPQKEITEQEDFKNHIREAFEKYKLERGSTKSLLRDDANEITKDAWGRELYFSFHPSKGRNYEIISAGEDGQFDSDDDISSHDDTGSTLKDQRVGKKSVLLFLFSTILFTISGSMLLRRFSPRRCGKLILSISVIIFFLYILLVPCIDPSFAVPTSLILTFIRVGISSGIMTGIFLLTRAVKKQKTDVSPDSGNGA